MGSLKDSYSFRSKVSRHFLRVVWLPSYLTASLCWVPHICPGICFVCSNAVHLSRGRSID